MSNYGLFVKGKMLGARQRNKVNGQGYYNEIGPSMCDFYYKEMVKSNMGNVISKR